MSVLRLACGGNLNYLPHTAAMIDSVLEQRGGLDVHVHYAHEPSLPASARDALSAMLEQRGAAVSFHAVANDSIAGLPEAGYLTTGMWYRIFLPELLADVDRVLYLDADTLAVDSLEPLWATDLGDHYVGAVTNVWEPWNLAYEESLDLPKPYFNSGVLLMNLDAMRRDGCTRRVIEYALAHLESLPWGDQTPLNAVLGARRLELHPRWNCMNSVLLFERAAEVFGAAAVEEARRSPGIRHFEGPSANKPWHFLCQSPGRATYRHHRRRTPWPRYRPEGITPRNVLTRLRRGRPQVSA